jgi:uncharacterized protein (UPF0332 family)
MALDEKQEARVLLAERLLELAEHSSEIEMRASLSRIYYAVYHVAIGLVGNKAHGEMAAALEQREEGLGERHTTLLELRQKADYDPEFVRRRFESLMVAHQYDPEQGKNEPVNAGPANPAAGPAPSPDGVQGTSPGSPNNPNGTPKP